MEDFSENEVEINNIEKKEFQDNIEQKELTGALKQLKLDLLNYQSLSVQKKIYLLDLLHVKMSFISVEEMEILLDEKVAFLEFFRINNPRINEAGVQILDEYVKRVNYKNLSFEIKEMIQTLMVKIYINRCNLGQFCQSIIFRFLEQDFNQNIEHILSLFSQSQYSKLILGCLSLLNEIILVFREQVNQNLSQIFGTLALFFDQNNKQVREKSLELFSVLIAEGFLDKETIQDNLIKLRKAQIDIVLKNDKVMPVLDKVLENVEVKQNSGQSYVKKENQQQLVQKKIENEKIIQQQQAQNEPCLRNKEQKNYSEIIKEQKKNHNKKEKKPVQFIVNNVPVHERPVSNQDVIIRVGWKVNLQKREDQQKFQQKIEDLSQDIDQLQNIFNYPAKLKDFKEQQTFLIKITQIFQEQIKGSYCFEIYWNFEPWIKGKPVLLGYVLEILEIYIEKVPPRQLKQTFQKESIENLVKQCAVAQKYTKIYKKSIDIINQLFQLGLTNEIFDVLIDCLQSSQNKNIVFTINLLIILLNNWGIQQMLYLNPFLPFIQQLCVSIKPDIRSACIEFFTEAYKWLGQDLLQKLKSIPNKQYQELYQILSEIKLKKLSPQKLQDVVYDPVNQVFKENNEEKEDQQQNQEQNECIQKEQHFEKVSKFQDDAIKQMHDDLLNDMSQMNQDQKIFENMEKIIKNLQDGDEQIDKDDQIQLEQNIIFLLGQKNQIYLNQVIIVCKEWCMQLKEKFSGVCAKIFPLLFEKFNDKRIDNNLLLKTLSVFQKYLESDLVIETAKIYMVSEIPEIKINCLTFLQKIFDLDQKEKKFENHIAQMEKQFSILTKEKDPNIKTQTLNLIAKIIQIYEEDPVHPLINQLKKREVRRIDRNVEKFEFINDVKENQKLSKISKALSDQKKNLDIEKQNLKNAQKLQVPQEEEIDEI